MARHAFGGDLAGWAFTVGASNVVTLSPNTIVTFFNARTGGTQYTDLAIAVDGSGPTTSVTTGDGNGGVGVGEIPIFYGPDGILAMWASAAGQARKLIVAHDLASAAASLTLAQVFSKLQTFGPTGDVNEGRVALYAEATGQVADMLSAYSGTDTGQGGVRQKTTAFNAAGELRLTAAKTTSVAMRVKGQTSQTANIVEHTDAAGTTVSWMAPDGAWRAPNLGHVIAFFIAGNLTVATGKHRIYNDTGLTLTIRNVRASVNTAPTGAAIRVDVNKNGVTVFTTQTNRPNIAVSTNTSKVSNMDVTTLADGDYLTVDVDVIGSTVAGADLAVTVLCY